MMDVQKYLHRIRFEPAVAVDKKTLFNLQKNHLLSIPFENLDIHYGRKISLSTNDSYQKIVIHNRGGFCYELNGLFHRLLEEIGFNAKLVSARVHTKNGEYSPEYDHLAIIVTLEQQDFLVDVGFGKFSLEPLKIATGHKITDSYGEFLFDQWDHDYYRISQIKGTEYIPQYIFTKKRRELCEFQARCEFHQTSKESHFTKKKLISMATNEGRISLSNTQLKITSLGVEKEMEFEESEFDNKLKEFFNIEIGK